MTAPLRVVHYVNQFFGGIGGEDQAHVGVSAREGAVGPGRLLERALGDGARVEATIVCGDNFASEREADASRAIGAELDRLKPDVLVAGPAFGSGRYGLACALACRVAQSCGIAAITAMHPENPGASSARRGIYIVPSGAATTSMQAALDALAPLARRLGRRETLGPSEVEGYMPRGTRRVHDRGQPGYQRALDMLLAKLHGRPFVTEANHQLHFYLLGDFPITLSKEQATARLKELGAVVDDKLSTGTDVLVLGNKPAAEGEQGPELTDSDDYKLADKLGIRIMRFAELADFLKY